MEIRIDASDYQQLIHAANLRTDCRADHGELQQEEALPSVRTLSRELRISALTVKKAYDALEQEGFIVTVHGKGSFVAAINNNVALEEQRREVEAAFEEAIRKARSCGMTKEEISQLLDIMMED